MDIPIFFLESIPPENVITLDENISKHVVQVLRMKPAESLQLTDGKGSIITVEIIDDHKKKCTVKVVEIKFIEKKEQQVCIAISLIKTTSRLEWFLEKATEIGVTELIPLICNRTEKQHFRYDRMRQILISAMMQSKQAWLPILHTPVSFEKTISSHDYSTNLIAHCLEEDKISISEYRHTPSVKILIGPEGDFTKEEIATAINANFKPVALGNTRLRAETAGVVAATVLCV